MGKTRDLLRKTEDIKRTFHASMGTIRGINANNLMKMRLRRCGKNIYIHTYIHIHIHIYIYIYI